jgi:hypothetical protein
MENILKVWGNLIIGRVLDISVPKLTECTKVDIYTLTFCLDITFLNTWVGNFQSTRF